MTSKSSKSSVAPPRRTKVSESDHATLQSVLALVRDDGKASRFRGSIPPSLRAAARSILDPDRIYRFRLASPNTVSSDGTGKIDTAIPFQISIAEWTDLQALFDEVRLESATLHIAPMPVAGTAKPSSLLVASQPAALAAVTSSQISANYSDVMTVAPLATSFRKITYHAPKSRPWCLTSDPQGSTSPLPTIPSGTMGAWLLNAVGEPLEFSAVYYHYLAENVIQLKLRV